MAQKTLIELIDDIDGGPADETIEFGFRGQTFEIDLAEEHIKEMAEFLSPFIEKARRISSPSLRSRSIRSVAHRPRPSVDYGDVRAWAAQNGYVVADRGRIPQKVIDAYNAR